MTKRRIRKPRTVTGRVAVRLREAVIGPATKFNWMRDDLEYVFMLIVAQATQQGLQPIDFDNDDGIDALSAIFMAVTDRDREIIHVTPEWRRVVISARAPRHAFSSKLPARRDHIGMRRAS